ncbi:30S ribosomal protein S3 [Candidatus Peregrinibacteria bacterium]|nr:30S ribosomal protein S3 [Candidatus Peregrinibacteria bacterium]
MGQKVTPNSLRLGIIYTWDSRWFASRKHFAKFLHNDLELKKLIREKLQSAALTQIEIERSVKKVTITIHAAKPGLIIGRQGVAIEDLRDFLQKKFKEQIDIHIMEVKAPDLSAVLLAKMVATQIEKRIAYRRACKLAIQKAIEAGAKGIKIQMAGRLNGVEIARDETFKEGNIPLHTLRADIDYAQVHAFTTYGAIGVKVWIYKGLVFKKDRLIAEVK